MKHCCTHMKDAVEFKCNIHADPYECPDNLVMYVEKFDEYGLIVHDGGTAKMAINFCPWCGTRLPESKRDRWFDELERLGYDNPSEQDIPENYRSGAWYRA